MEKRSWCPLLATYTVKGLLKPRDFWWTAGNLLLVRFDGEQFIHPVGYNLWDSGWSEYTFNSQPRRTYGSFAKRFKEEKKDGEGCVWIVIKTLSVAWWVTGGKLNFPSWSPSSPAQMWKQPCKNAWWPWLLAWRMNEWFAASCWKVFPCLYIHYLEWSH